jgi:hypothetical protein
MIATGIFASQVGLLSGEVTTFLNHLLTLMIDVSLKRHLNRYATRQLW